MVPVVVAGAIAIASAIASEPDPAEPSQLAVGPIGRSTPAVPHRPSAGVVLPASEPVALEIPAIGVDADIQALGLNADGTIEVPAPGPDYDVPAWYDLSPTPGSLGPSIISGHVDSVSTGPSVFFDLDDLEPGDTVLVTREDGLVARFAVEAVRRYHKDDFPTKLVYGDTDHAALRLITCGGAFDRSSNRYVDNVIAFASLIGTTDETGRAS